jgi:hypothetical protein
MCYDASTSPKASDAYHSLKEMINEHKTQCAHLVKVCNVSRPIGSSGPSGQDSQRDALNDRGAVVENHRGPQHPVQRKLDQVGCARGDQVPRLAGAHAQDQRACTCQGHCGLDRPQRTPHQAPLDFFVVIFVLADSHHHHR